MTKYHLSEYVYAGIADGRIVFIDFKTDRYVALPTEATSILKSLATDRTLHFINAENMSHSKKRVDSLINQLLNNDLITPKSSQSATSAKRFKHPKRDLSDGFLLTTPNINITSLLFFLYSFIISILEKKLIGPRWLIKHTQKFKTRKNKTAINIDSLIYTFRYIRSFFYTSHNHCFFDCAVLIHYLKLHGHTPEWIFGAKFEPFRAHCWVQVEDLLVSCQLRETAIFHPIAIL